MTIFLNAIRCLARDERGFVQSSQAVLLTVIVCLGIVAGLVTLRDMIVQEYGDVGLALENLNQSYHYEIRVFNDPDNPDAYVVLCPSTYTDTVGSLTDAYDIETDTVVPGGSPGNVAPSLLDQDGVAPKGITFTGAVGEGVELMLPSPPGPNEGPASSEGDPLPQPAPGPNGAPPAGEN